MTNSELTGADKSDLLGYLLFLAPPVIVGLRFLGIPLSEFVVIPIVLVALVFGDATRWSLPRWLWLPAMALLWPIALPGYGLIRRFNGAPAYLSLGIMSVVGSYFIFAQMLKEGLICRPIC